MYHYLICGNDLHRNNKLHVLNINIIINIYFKNSLKFILKLNFNIYVHKKTIHLSK
jgi:hypothetical protein